MATKVDLQKLNSFLKGKIGPCSMCGQRGTYSASLTVMEMREFQEGNLVIGGSSQILPLIPLTCTNCGNTIFINGIVSGVVSSNPAQEKKEG